jgi:hypothetical protein
MKLIAVTQRVEVTAGERRDALDQRWSTFLACASLSPLPDNNLIQYGGDAQQPCELQSSPKQSRGFGLMWNRIMRSSAERTHAHLDGI